MFLQFELTKTSGISIAYLGYAATHGRQFALLKMLGCNYWCAAGYVILRMKSRTKWACLYVELTQLTLFPSGGAVFL